MHKTKHSSHESDHARKKRFERKRYLNVIYFIDSQRTRTLKFTTGASYFTVGALIVAVVWSIVATGLLIRDRFVIAEMSSHSKSLLDTVFNYQTRYDEVYEKAYPNPVGTPEAIVEQEPEAPIQLSAKALDKDKDKDKVAGKSANLEPAKPVLPVDQAAIAKDKSNIEPMMNELPISIDNFASTLLGKSLTIRLSLKNLASPTKSSGSIAGTANFVDTNNQTHVITGRAIRSGDEDEHFNIRYFKNKNLIFEAPKDLGGKFTDVKVLIKDDQGHSKEFPYTVNKEVPATVAAPVATMKTEEKRVQPEVSKVEEAPAVKAEDETAPSEERTEATDATSPSGETETPSDVSN